LYYQLDKVINDIGFDGQGLKHLQKEFINNYPFFLPIEAEQLTIANYLDNQTQKIDRLINNKKAQVEKLKELRQIEINNAVTKGLNPNAEMKDSGIDWLGKIPKHWELKRLKNLANQISEKSIEILDDDFLVALENIESNTGKFIETASEYENNGIKFKKGNLLYNKLRPYLNKVFQADKDGVCVGDIIVIECTQRLHPTFLQYRMLSDAFCSVIMSSVYGAKMPRTSWQFISSLKIGYPSFDEQVQITEHLNKRTIAIENLIQNINLQIDKLQELRKIKIYEVVTGKIKVNAYVEAPA
jgi:restriction endonuclease S subunit